MLLICLVGHGVHEEEVGTPSGEPEPNVHPYTVLNNSRPKFITKYEFFMALLQHESRTESQAEHEKGCTSLSSASCINLVMKQL